MSRQSNPRRTRRTAVALLAGFALAAALAVVPSTAAFATPPKPSPPGHGGCQNESISSCHGGGSSTDPGSGGSTGGSGSGGSTGGGSQHNPPPHKSPDPSPPRACGQGGVCKPTPACGQGGPCSGNNGTNNPSTPTTTLITPAQPCVEIPLPNGGILEKGKNCIPISDGQPCVISSTPMHISGEFLGTLVAMGGEMATAKAPGGGLMFTCEFKGLVFIPAPPASITLQVWQEIHALMPQIWAMPSTSDPASQVFTVASPADDQVAWVNRPEWLALKPESGISTPLVKTRSKCVSLPTGGNKCASVTITATPEYVDWYWSDSTSTTPPSSAGGTGPGPANPPPAWLPPAPTMMCTASLSTTWAPPDLQSAQVLDQSAPMIYQFESGPSGAPEMVYGGPGCYNPQSTSTADTGPGASAPNGGPTSYEYGVQSAPLGGTLPVPAITPDQVSQQDCINQAGGDYPASPNWASWCDSLPVNATVLAWVYYKVSWKYVGLAQTPPSPTTGIGDVAGLRIPVLAQHVYDCTPVPPATTCQG